MCYCSLKILKNCTVKIIHFQCVLSDLSCTQICQSLPGTMEQSLFMVPQISDLMSFYPRNMGLLLPKISKFIPFNCLILNMGAVIGVP